MNAREARQKAIEAVIAEADAGRGYVEVTSNLLRTIVGERDAIEARLEGLKPWLHHLLSCVLIQGTPWTLQGLLWKPGDEATCTCGLAVALGLKEGG